MKVKVNDFIKSYDFMNNTDCYMIGFVTKVENGMAECDTLFQVFDGDRCDDFPKTFKTPLPGKLHMDAMYPNFKRIEMIWSN